MTRLRMTTLALAATLAAAMTAAAQEKPGPEVGITTSLSVLSGGGESLTVFSLPGGGFWPQAVVYGTFFPSSSFAVEPQLGYSLISSGGDTESFGIGALQLEWFPGDDAAASPYLFGHAALQFTLGGGTNATPAFGGGIGYRKAVAEHVAIRVEGRYRRWVEGDLNDFTASFGFGVILGH